MINYSSIREKLKVENHTGDTEGLAFLTHYLHNHENGVAESYQQKATEYFELRAKESGIDIAADSGLQAMLPIKWDIPFPSPKDPEFTFIDLFAGIGGFRIPLQELGGKCVFSSEFNQHAQRAYELNFGEVPFGDITKLDINIVPKHNILCAGFPCQPFSISGKMKGFEDTRGTLIYHVFEIIEKRKPEVVLLENVKHLVYHDKKRTLATIVQHLEDLGYKVSKKVLNASDFGVPQNRERIIIIGHREKVFDFSKIKKQAKPVLKDFLDTKNDFEYLDEPYTILKDQKRQVSGLIFAGYRNKTIRKAGVRPGTEHLSRVHKQPNRIYSTEGVHPALPSQESSGRFWIWHEKKVRKLTIEECYRIMGFPKNFKMIYNRGELYKQIGNSVAIPMINAVAEQIKKQLLNTKSTPNETIRVA
ncbi:MAG: DNA (cytosine-5-)-methyltransferase [Bacteroidales bacterium]|nr:DNA (cytosine-5-)-methyltransferase [Bacteroidales bacterium]